MFLSYKVSHNAKHGNSTIFANLTLNDGNIIKNEIEEGIKL